MHLFSKVRPFEMRTFLAGEPNSEFLKGSPVQSLDPGDRLLVQDLPCDSHYLHRWYPWYLCACLLLERGLDPKLFLLWGMVNTSSSWLKSMGTFSLKLLGKEGKGILECTFIEVVIFTVHLQFIWDSHIAFNLYSTFCFLLFRKSIRVSPWLAIMGHLTNGL